MRKLLPELGAAMVRSFALPVAQRRPYSIAAPVHLPCDYHSRGCLVAEAKNARRACTCRTSRPARFYSRRSGPTSASVQPPCPRAGSAYLTEYSPGADSAHVLDAFARLRDSLDLAYSDSDLAAARELGVAVPAPDALLTKLEVLALKPTPPTVFC